MRPAATNRVVPARFNSTAPSVGERSEIVVCTRTRRPTAVVDIEIV